MGMKNNTPFKIGYLPLSKVNWTNDTLVGAAFDAEMRNLSDRQIKIVANG